MAGGASVMRPTAKLLKHASEDLKTVKCPACQKRFLDKKSLREHLTSDHTVSEIEQAGVMVFSC